MTFFVLGDEMKKKITIALTLVLGIAIGSGGTILLSKKYTPATSYHKSAATNSKASTQVSLDKYPAIKISQHEALRRFQRLYSSAEISSILLKVDHDNYIYEIEGFDNKKTCTIQINAENGEIIGQSTVINSFTDTEQNSLNLKKLISRQQATQIAENYLKGATAREWHLYYDNQEDRNIWKIKLVDHQEIQDLRIDANNQKIITSKD